MAYEGVCATTLIVGAKLLSRVGFRVNESAWYWRLRGMCFDRRFNVATSDEVDRNDLDIESSMKPLVVHYSPTPPVGFGLTLSGLGIDHTLYSFIDYGCGRGRALVMAGEFPFREIIGLELSPRLADAARSNLAQAVLTTRQCYNARVVEGDASHWQLPDGLAVLYFFNPFGEELMRETLHKIARSLKAKPRHLVIVYYNPVHRRLFDNTEFLCAVPVASETHAQEWAVYESRT